MLTTLQMKANETHFLFYLKHKSKMYMWKDNANVYDMSSGKIVPHTMKGFVELAAIVRMDFCKIFLELPELVDMRSSDGFGFITNGKDLDKMEMLQRVETIAEMMK